MLHAPFLLFLPGNRKAVRPEYLFDPGETFLLFDLPDDTQIVVDHFHIGFLDLSFPPEFQSSLVLSPVDVVSGRKNRIVDVV